MTSSVKFAVDGLLPKMKSSFLVENMPAESVERASLLAIAWDRKVQVAKLVKSELKVYGKWSLESAAIGVAWLDDQVFTVYSSSVMLNLCCSFSRILRLMLFGLQRLLYIVEESSLLY